ncbi:MAG TPA: aldo/keto reductase [Acidimicrobiia bacterium]|nr:aldo/keto reductase [Acidimicrobiia bacterium]
MNDTDSALALPELGMGCWSFAGGQYWGDQPRQASIRTVHAALDAGVTLFDTAENYVDDHHSEEVLGEALAGRRDEALIATKVSTKNLRRDDLIASAEASLRRLGTDRIDLYQIHWPNWEIPLAETAEAVDSLLDSGKIRAFGVCNFGPVDLAELIEIRRPVSDQMAYNLLWRGVEDQVVPILLREGIDLMCYSPLAQGLLTGRYGSADEVKGGLASSRIFSSGRGTATHGDPGFESEAFDAISLLLGLAKEHAVEPAQLAIAWNLAQPAVSTVLVGAQRPEEIESMAAWVHGGTDHVSEAIDQLTQRSAPLKEKLGGNLDMWVTGGRIR